MIHRAEALTQLSNATLVRSLGTLGTYETVRKANSR